jgi:hypothetical protein
MKSLRESIDWTLKYFSFFHFPPTAFEIWKWQRGTKYSYQEVVEELEAGGGKGIFFTQLNQNVEDLALERHRRYQDAIAKYRRVQWYVWYLARLPWVQGVAFCNNLPFHNTKKGSDIDLFILTKPGALWKTRLFAITPLRLLQLRPGEAKQHPIDVSFFVSTDSMSLEHLQIEDDDPYLAMWVVALSPVFERSSGVFRTFWDQNMWATKQFPQAVTGGRASFWRSTQRWKLPILFPESLSKQLQEKILPNSLTSPSNFASIVMNDSMLKFHQNDRRKEINAFLCR